MIIIDHIIKQARINPRAVVLAEGDDIRIIEAAVRATDEGIASCVLVGSRDAI